MVREQMPERASQKLACGSQQESGGGRGRGEANRMV